MTPKPRLGPALPQRIGRYRVVDLLGEGGMGLVYRAADESLGRDVAIKVLPRALLSDHDRVERFRSEARALAMLNHPAIATVHSFERDEVHHDASSSVTWFLVMELAEGMTLADRLELGPMAVDDVIVIARQIAAGLEHAHAHGIVHRDLKPANVMVTDRLAAKILDFGLAKALHGGAADATDPDESPTLAARTRAGVLLGTAAYMSPEQARGRLVDARCDLWALGCVLFEMLSGRKAFPGATISDTLALVLREEPSWSLLPHDTPAGVRRLLRRCLMKDPEKRLRHAGDALLELEDTSEDASAAEPQRRSSWGWRARVGAFLVATALLTFAGGYWTGHLPEPKSRASSAPVRFTMRSPPDQKWEEFAVSPDGRIVVFVARAGDESQLYRRDLGASMEIPIPATEGASRPFFSPDGEWLGFVQDAMIRRVRPRGGDSFTICDGEGDVDSATWSPDGNIYFSHGRGSGIFRVSAGGGVPEQVAAPRREEGETHYSDPQALPEGRKLLFLCQTRDGVETRSLDLTNGATKPVSEGASAWLSEVGYLFFVDVGSRTAGLLRIAPIDLDSMELTRAPTTIVSEPVGEIAERGGTFVLTARAPRIHRFLRLDPSGRLEPLPFDGGPYAFLKLSPDGRQIAVNEVSNRDGIQVWLLDLERRTRHRLTFDGVVNARPVWSPDGRQVAYSNAGLGTNVWIHRLSDGNRSPLSASESPLFAYSWSARDEFACLGPQKNSPQGSHLWIVPRGAPDDRRNVSGDLGGVEFPSFSSDGRWIVYHARQTGREEVFVQSAMGDGAALLVSADGGVRPVWSRDDRYLYYLAACRPVEKPFRQSCERVHRVSVARGGTLTLRASEVIYDAAKGGSRVLELDSAPDGSLLLLVDETPTSTTAEVIVNWPAAFLPEESVTH